MRQALLTAFLLAIVAATLPRSAAAIAPATGDDAKILQALNRLAFGLRPGDLERVKQVGMDRWVDQQLRPGRINDSPAEAQLSPLEILRFTPDQLAIAFLTDQPAYMRGAQQMTAMTAQARGAGLPPGTALRLDPLGAQYARAAQMALPRGTSIEAVGELIDAKLALAIGSERQLQEVLVDFWSNHFNLDVKKAVVRTYIVAADRDTIRPCVLGRFRDLLGASSKSPAMLYYLDNFRSSRTLPIPQRMGSGPAQVGGLNENYARELMELHTLGVDGGYTQKDVQEVARCFTGWGIDPFGNFQFYPLLHDPGEKIVLGHRIAASGGIQDGETVLDILAQHPSTARFISRKLCVRFVADEPPGALVDRAAQVFLKTGGDLREVVRTIATSAEFYAPQARRCKVKSPFELAVSAVRALGGSLVVPDPRAPVGWQALLIDGRTSVTPNAGQGAPRPRRSVAEHIAIMGQPLFSCQPPTGYPEDSRQWLSSESLMARLNFVGDLANGRVAWSSIPPVSVPDPRGGPARILEELSRRLLGEPLPAGTIAALKDHLSAAARPVALAALVLGSPQFQKR